jgi:hypothetical protein
MVGQELQILAAAVAVLAHLLTAMQLVVLAAKELLLFTTLAHKGVQAVIQ